MAVSSQFWCDESLFVTVKGPWGSTTIAVDKPFARIGSHSGSEVVLEEAGLEARCLYLHATVDGVFCVWLLPSQERTVGSGEWLLPDQQVQIGPYQISARLQSESGGTTPPPAALTAWGSASAPLPVCEVFAGNKVRDKRRFRAKLNLIGRRGELALQVQGPQVSSCHCALYWDCGKLWCIDLLSSNGTLLQGQKIDWVLLGMGQAIQIGEFSLRLKRLSHASVRESRWRTAESDGRIPRTETTASNRAALAGPQDAITVSAASGSPQNRPPLASPLELPTPRRAGLSTIVAFPSPEALRSHTVRGAEEGDKAIIQRPEPLEAQRVQLEEKKSKESQEIASQVRHLQSEADFLAVQRKEFAQLRAELEEQRRVLSDDLKSLKRELVEQQAQNDRKQDVDAASATPIAAANGNPVNSVGFTADRQALGPAGQSRFFSPRDENSSTKTVIEASYVVEKESARTALSARRDPFPANSLDPSWRPLGRRPAAELTPASSTLPKESLGVTPVSVASSTAIEPTQAIALPGSAGTSAPSAMSNSMVHRLAGRKKPAEEEDMGAFVTERLVQREASGRFWLRVLWGVAAATLLLALTGLGYVVLTAG